MADKLLEEVDRIISQYVILYNELERVWADYMVFTWHWWVGLALGVLPWVLWIIVRDRRRSARLLFAGFFTMITASILDDIGISQGAWSYNTSLLPYFPQYLPWDLTIMPVTAMLFYQYWPRITARLKKKLRFIKSPWVASIVFGAVGSFVAEPLFSLIGFYELALWEYYYSCPIYALIYMAGWLLYTRKSFAPPDIPTKRNL